MSTAPNEATRCRKRAEACRRIARQAPTSDLRDSYFRLARAHEILAEAVEQLDLTDEWFAARLTQDHPAGQRLSTAR